MSTSLLRHDTGEKPIHNQMNSVSTEEDSHLKMPKRLATVRPRPQADEETSIIDMGSRPTPYKQPDRYRSGNSGPIPIEVTTVFQASVGDRELGLALRIKILRMLNYTEGHAWQNHDWYTFRPKSSTKVFVINMQTYEIMSHDPVVVEMVNTSNHLIGGIALTLDEETGREAVEMAAKAAAALIEENTID